MTGRRFSRPCRLDLVWLIFIAPLITLGAEALGAEPEPVAASATAPAAHASPEELRALIEKLGDDSYEVRTQATARLAGIGLEAREALEAGLKHPDPEVQRRCRWVLADLLEADYQQRLEAFLADQSGSPDHNIPGWKRYRGLIGYDKAARELFVQMQRAERGLLISAEAGTGPAAESVNLRLRQVAQQMSMPMPDKRVTPSLGSVAAILFVCCDPDLDLPREAIESPYLMSMVQQEEYRKALTEGQYKDAARKLLGQWMLQPASIGILYSKIMLALQYDIKEGLRPACESLKDSQNMPSHLRMYAIQAVGKLGGRPYAKLLEGMLADKTPCYQAVINNKRISVETRDIALAWLIYLTEQDFADYGLDKAKEAFEQIEKNRGSYPNFMQLAFDDDAARAKALEKWKAYVADHPLPDPPDPAFASQSQEEKAEEGEGQSGDTKKDEAKEGQKSEANKGEGQKAEVKKGEAVQAEADPPAKPPEPGKAKPKADDAKQGAKHNANQDARAAAAPIAVLQATAVEVKTEKPEAEKKADSAAVEKEDSDNPASEQKKQVDKNEAEKTEDAKQKAAKAAAKARAAKAQVVVAGGARVVIAAGGGVIGVPAVAAAAPPKAAAANGADAKKEEEEAPPPGLQLQIADRLEVQQLERARELCRRGQYADGVRLLDAILADPAERAFRPDRQASLWRCLKPEAEQILEGLPEAGRAAYRLHVGALAERQLAEAAAAGDPEKLEEVARRYFHTPAGAEATYLLAQGRLDADQPLHAAFLLMRLRDHSHDAATLEPALSLLAATCWFRAGMPAEADSVLRRMPAAGPVEVAGRATPLFAATDQPRAWLEAMVGPPWRAAAEGGWLMYRGNAARNAAGETGGPYPAGRRLLATCPDENLEKVLDALIAEHREAYRVAIPQLCPLVIGRKIVVRTATRLVAMELGTGRVLWEAPLEDALRHFLEDPHRDNEVFASEYFRTGTQRRFFEDLSFGSLSSDGHLVFGVEDLAFGFGPDYQRMVVTPDGRRRLDSGVLKQYNRLAAYDLATGKLRWELGGPPESAGVELPGVFFLGPPLPLGGRLYAVAEVERQTRLLELDAENGRLSSSLALALKEPEPESSTILPMQMLPATDRQRRRGTSPSCADGILVCRAADDQLVAVELASRRVLWVYQATEQQEIGLRRQLVQRWQQAMLNATDPDQAGRWLDDSITVADGRVLLSSPDSEELVCIGLLDGRLSWSAPRRDGLYVAAVADGQVVVVGRGGLWALRLADGTPAWSPERVAWPAGALPSGRGFLGEGRYFVPLSTAEVAAVDLRRGRLAARARSPEGLVPGNLLSCGGDILSQAAKGLWQFDTLAAREARLAEALDKQPDDPQLKAQKGEVLLAEGRIGEAVALLRDALRQRPSPELRTRLADALLDGLRIDFAAFDDLAGQLDQLVDRAERRPAMLRELAAGLAEAGRLSAAFEVYLKLLAADPDPAGMERFEAARAVRHDLWLAARLKELYTAAPPELTSTLDERILAELAAAESDAAQPPGASPPPAEEEPLAEEEPPADDASDSKDAAQNGTDDPFGQPSAGAAPDAMAAPESQADQKPGASPARARRQRLERFLTYFGWHSSAGGARLELGKLLADDRQWLPAEQLFLRVLDQGSEPKQREAVARLALLMRRAGRSDESAPYYARLAGELAEAECLEGQTGGELVAALPEGERRRLLAPPDPWPTGKVHVVAEEKRSNPGYRFPIDVETAGRWYDAEQTVALDVQTRKLVACDRVGRQSWQAELNTDGSNWQYNLSPYRCGQGWQHGHLLYVWLGNYVGVFDTLSDPPKLLWKQEAFSTNPRFPGMRMVIGMFGMMPGQVNPLPASDSLPLVAAGGALYYVQDAKLLALDPFSGDQLWMRDDLQPGSNLFGDGEILLVSPPDSDQAMVLSAADGRELGTCRVPPTDEQMWTFGRRVVVWQESAARTRLAMVDPWAGTTVWEHDFAPKAKPWPIGRDEAAALEPAGRLVIVRLPSGQPRLETQLEAEEQLDSLAVLRSATRYAVVVNRLAAQGAMIISYPYARTVPVNGRVYGLERETGKVLWQREMENQAVRPDQPSGLPLLALFNQTNIVEDNRVRQTVKLTCLDRRDGRVLHDQESNRAGSNLCDLEGDPENNSVQVTSSVGTVKFTFTDQPDDQPQTTPASKNENAENNKAAEDKAAEEKQSPEAALEKKAVPEKAAAP